MLRSGLILPNNGLTIPPPNIETLGFPAAQPFNDFSHASGNIVGMRLTPANNGNFYEARIRGRKSTGGTAQMRCALYNNNGGDNYNARVVSADVRNFSNTDTEMIFSIAKALVTTTDIYLMFQANATWFFYYDNTPAVFTFQYFGNFAVGSFPATGTATPFENRIRAWGFSTY